MMLGKFHKGFNRSPDTDTGRRALKLHTATSLLVAAGLLRFLLPEAARADTETWTLKPETHPTLAAESLRMAVAGFEAAERLPFPDAWTPLHLERGQSRTLGPGLFLLLMEPKGPLPRILFVDEAGPHEASLGPGQEVTLGSLAVLLLGRSVDDSAVDLLIRAADPAPLLIPDSSDRKLDAVITVASSPSRVVMVSESARAVRFARAFFEAFEEGHSAQDAARTARALVPPGGGGEDTKPATWPQRPPQEPDPRRSNATMPDRRTSRVVANSNEPPQAALVTLNLVRGDSGSLFALSTEAEVRSDGARDGSPPVSATGGGRGTSVSAGHRGGQFRARLDALEANKKVNVENRVFLRVQLGGREGRSQLSINGPAGTATAWVKARLRGSDRVELAVDQTGGDWSFLGAVSTVVTVRDGNTVLLAQNTMQRTQSTRSGVPVLRDVPLVGPVFGSERTASESSTYALYATVELE